MSRMYAGGTPGFYGDLQREFGGQQPQGMLGGGMPSWMQEYAHLFPSMIRGDQFKTGYVSGNSGLYDSIDALKDPMTGYQDWRNGDIQERYSVDMGNEMNPDGSRGGWSSTDNNWSVGKNADGTIGLMFKSGNKVGSGVTYKQDADGNWVPDWSKANQIEWDTNQKKNEAAYAFGLSAAGMLGAGLGAAGAFGGAAGGASGAGGAAGAVPGGASYGFTLPGLEAGGAGWGTAAGATGAGAGAGLEVASYLPEAAGAITGTGEGLAPLYGGLEAAAGGAGSTVSTMSQIKDLVGKGMSVIEAIQKVTGGNTGSFDLGNIINAIGSGVNASKNEDYVDRLLAEGIARQGEYKAAGDKYATGLLGLNDKYGDLYDAKYANVNNGFATSNVDPATGKVGYSLNAPYATARDQYLDSANKVMGQAKDFNPQTFAADRFKAWQGLLAPERSKQGQDLLQSLNTSGRMGLSVNTDTQNGVVGLNPIANAMFAAQAQADKEAGYQSLREGESYLDNLLSRQKGLFGQATDLETRGGNVLNDASTWSNTFNSNNRAKGNFLYGNEKEALATKMNSEQDYIKALLGLNSNAMAADYLRQNRMITGASAPLPGANTGGGINYGQIINSLPWKSIFNGLFG